MIPYDSDVTIIGAGAVGAALARAMDVSNVPIKGLYSRDDKPCADLAEELGVPCAGRFPGSLKELGVVTFICVPDDQIAGVAGELARLGDDLRGRYFVHTSGANPSHILSGLTEKNARVASFHPLQTFERGASHRVFHECYVTLEGSDDVLPMLEELATELKAKPLRVNPEEKKALHLAGVMACNYLVSLTDAAQQALESKVRGVDLLEVLRPLMERTIENLFEHGIDASLTGPISRGDRHSVESHLELLDGQPELCRLYCQLGAIAADIAYRRGSLEDAIYKDIKQLLGAWQE